MIFAYGLNTVTNIVFILEGNFLLAKQKRQLLSIHGFSCWINMYFIIWENGRRGFPGFIFIFLQLFKAGLAFPGFRSARQKSQNAPSS